MARPSSPAIAQLFLVFNTKDKSIECGVPADVVAPVASTRRELIDQHAGTERERAANAVAFPNVVEKQSAITGCAPAGYRWRRRVLPEFHARTQLVVNPDSTIGFEPDPLTVAWRNGFESYNDLVPLERIHLDFDNVVEASFFKRLI